MAGPSAPCAQPWAAPKTALMAMSAARGSRTARATSAARTMTEARITGSTARAWGHGLRARYDAIMIGLNTALALADSGALNRYGVELIGAQRAAIEMAEDRKLFREAMDRIGLENPKATIVAAPKLASGKYDINAGVAQAMDALEEIGLPAIIRPAFTLGGTGGGIAYNKAEFETQRRHMAQEWSNAVDAWEAGRAYTPALAAPEVSAPRFDPKF